MATTLQFLKDVLHVAQAGDVKTFPNAVAEQWRGKGIALEFVTPKGITLEFVKKEK